MTVGIGPERAVSEEVQPGGAQLQQDRVPARPPPRPGRPPGRPGACKRGGVSSEQPQRPQALADGRDERVVGRRERQMILLPESLTEYVLNLRWTNEVRLWIVEEVACGVQTSGTGARGMKEAWERMLRATERGDRKAEEAAFVDYTRAEVWNWWQGFPERRLLTELYRRAARRQEGGGSPDRSRRPSHGEGLRVARPILAYVADPGQFDVEWEFAAMSTVLVALYLPPFGVRSQGLLQEYVGLSRSSRVYFDALVRIGSRRSFKTGARPSPAPSPGGGRRLPACSGGVPPGSPSGPIAPSKLPPSRVTSMSSS